MVSYKYTKTYHLQFVTTSRLGQNLNLIDLEKMDTHVIVNSLHLSVFIMACIISNDALRGIISKWPKVREQTK